VSCGLVDQWISGLALTSHSLPRVPRTAGKPSPFAAALLGYVRETFAGRHDQELVSSNTPLIRLRHLLPPQKARGEKALDWRGSRGRSRDCAVAVGFSLISPALNGTPSDAQKSRPFAPALLSGGEGGRRPDEGAFAACVIGALDWRGSQGRSAEGVVALGFSLISPALNGTPSDAQRPRPFAPALLSGGEGGRRPDEGAFAACVFGASGALSVSPNTPLIRLRHLLPPQNTRGEKALDGRGSETGARKCSRTNPPITNPLIHFPGGPP
jgi:hypothetical protein